MNRLKFERNCDCSKGYTFKGVRNIYIFFLLFPIADYSQLGWKNRRGSMYLQRIRIPSIERENFYPMGTRNVDLTGDPRRIVRK